MVTATRVLDLLNEAANPLENPMQSIETTLKRLREIVEDETDIDIADDIQSVSDAGSAFDGCAAVLESTLYFPINLLAARDFIYFPQDVTTALDTLKSELYVEMKNYLAKKRVTIPDDAEEPLTPENLVELGAGEAAMALTEIRDELEVDNGIQIKLRVGARKQEQGLAEIVGEVRHAVGNFETDVYTYKTEPKGFARSGRVSTVKQLAGLIELALDLAIDSMYALNEEQRDQYDSDAESALDLLDPEFEIAT